MLRCCGGKLLDASFVLRRLISQIRRRQQGSIRSEQLRLDVVQRFVSESNGLLELGHALPQPPHLGRRARRLWRHFRPRRDSPSRARTPPPSPHFGGACFLTGDRSVLRGGVFSSGDKGMAPSEWRRMDRRTFRAFGTSRCSWMAPKGVRPSFVGGLRVSFWYSGTAPRGPSRFSSSWPSSGRGRSCGASWTPSSCCSAAAAPGCGGRGAARRLAAPNGLGAELAVAHLTCATRASDFARRYFAAPIAGAVSTAGVLSAPPNCARFPQKSSPLRSRVGCKTRFYGGAQNQANDLAPPLKGRHQTRARVPTIFAPRSA